MAFKKIAAVVCFAGSLALFLSFLNKKDERLCLSYCLNYEGDSWQKQKTGFLWALSYLGAELPEGAFDKSIEWVDSSSFKLNFNTLGFDEHALNALNEISDSIRQTPYYKTYGKIDLGQFIALTIGSSWHYYAITNAESNFKNYREKYHLATANRFDINHSTVAKHNRIIYYKTDSSILKTAFVAEEGEGELGIDFTPGFFETINIMKNGQLKFAIYNAEGNLVSASPAHLGSAGKPAKCMWCHEIIFSPLFTKTDTLNNKISPEEFQALIQFQNNKLNHYRNTLHSDIDFTKTQDHTQMELLYIGYKEPSVRKFAREWNLTDAETNAIIKQNRTHIHNEFSYMNQLLYRDSLLLFFKTPDIKAPESIREPCANEPCFIKNN